jgi:hypothetical protein
MICFATAHVPSGSLTEMPLKSLWVFFAASVLNKEKKCPDANDAL